MIHIDDSGHIVIKGNRVTYYAADIDDWGDDDPTSPEETLSRFAELKASSEPVRLVKPPWHARLKYARRAFRGVWRALRGYPC